MKWTISTPPTALPVTWETAKSHLILEGTEDKDYVEGLIAAATDYAQDEMQTSLMAQTITAVYYLDDFPDRYRSLYALPCAGAPDDLFVGSRPTLRLPRGPVTAITSVTNANGHTIAPSAYALERAGLADKLRIGAGVALPLTVVYVAGYASADAVPAGIRHGILTHVATLYENRESIADKGMSIVPHSLADFYRRKGRGTGIG